jgi:hypothetical protein
MILFYCLLKGYIAAYGYGTTYLLIFSNINIAADFENVFSVGWRGYKKQIKRHNASIITNILFVFIY